MTLMSAIWSNINVIELKVRFNVVWIDDEFDDWETGKE